MIGARLLTLPLRSRLLRRVRRAIPHGELRLLTEPLEDVPGFRCLALHSAKLVGQLTCSPAWQERLGIPGWWLMGVRVQGLWRGMGIGERLVTAAREEARLRGIQVLYLNVFANNAPAIALFRKVGFLPVEGPAAERLTRYYHQVAPGIAPSQVWGITLAPGAILRDPSLPPS